MHRTTGKGSSAKTVQFLDRPRRIWVQGLIGCTSVSIISEAGAWVSHFWEEPGFNKADQARFNDDVLDAIRNGDNNVNMPAAYPLGQDGNYLNPSNNVQIFIMAPADTANNQPLYPDRLGQVENVLTGPGAPWEGVQITRHLYAKPDFSGATTGEQRQRILENFNNDKSAKGKVLVEYDNHQGEDLDDLDEYGLPQEYDKNPPAIWRILMESEEHHHVWQPRPNQEPDSCGNGNRKRDGSCSKTAGSSGVSTASSSNSHGSSETASSSTTPSTAASLGSSTKSSSQTTSKPVITSTSGPGSTITPPPTSTSARTSGPSSTSLRCRHHADPDHGPGNEYCICEGHDGKYPMLSSTSGMSDYNICGYSTLPPTMTPASHPPFTATLSDGEVVQCASSTYYNYAVDHRPTCAGSTSVISTVASIASAYASSTSAAAASRSAASSSAAMASWSADAAKPSAGCSILDDDGWGDSLFMVYGINGWAGDDGSKLHDQEDGCGILSGWQWYVGDVEEFEGHERSAEHAVFGLSFFKGGCVEDAVKSAGGPDITCHHDNGEHSSPSMADAKSIAQKAQVSAVKALANGSLSARARRGDAGAISPQPTRTAKGRPTKTNAALVESAKAALPHLLEKIGASSDV